MPVDYEKIRQENIIEHGRAIGRTGQMFFADAYADRTHFILELLQNAEDSIGKRGEFWGGDRTVSFHLSQELLRFSHYGRPFDADDVRSICDIGKSTKSDEYTAIGRFGIGFKSVYAFTTRPEVHSGDEDFAIESFVRPTAVEAIERDPDETVFLIPLDREDPVRDNDQIADALSALDPRAFLFLRHIKELHWEVEGCDYGHYLREVTIEDDLARRVTVKGNARDLAGKETPVHEEWLIFSRAVQHNCKEAGHVEIAFRVDEESGAVRGLNESKLIVYFPTVVETRLGFLVQGPYRTTPNRDNVPEEDDWNQHLVNETGSLLKDSLIWLRDRGRLDAEVLGCLPLDLFPDSMFEPLFHVTKQALSTERLLPKYEGGYVSANRALLGDSAAVRGLLTDRQLFSLYDDPMSWLTGDFTVDLNQELRRYLMTELSIREVTPASIVAQLNHDFLSLQSDSWMVRLYEFLGERRGWALQRLYAVTPLVRLADGNHVVPATDEHPNAYLPTVDPTDFPTVHQGVCGSNESIAFLESLGIKRPDIVDDVIVHVLDKYDNPNASIGEEEYESDVNRICTAYRGADNDNQRSKLTSALTDTPWVMTTDIGHGTRRRSKPGDVYLPTRRLQLLFSAVSGVRFVDTTSEALKSALVQDLLIECGVSNNLRPVRVNVKSRFGYTERREMRINSHGDDRSTEDLSIHEWDIEGLVDILDEITHIKLDMRSQMSSFLWESLCEIDRDYFEGMYVWRYYTNKHCSFDCSFIDLLNEYEWIATSDGDLKRPADIEFDELDWPSNEFLMSKIKFKSSSVDNFAKERGISAQFLNNVVKGIESGEVTEEDWYEYLASRNGEMEPEDNDRPSDIADRDGDGPTRPFASMFFSAQSISTAVSPDSLVVLPTSGPRTKQSAMEHTRASRAHGRDGAKVPQLVRRWRPTVASKKLTSDFHRMVRGDYVGRCQICGDSFAKSDGELQVNVVHVLPPRADTRTNHFGNLLGLCGGHFSMVRYGDWYFLDPETNQRFQHNEHSRDWQNFRVFVDQRSPSFDEFENEYFGMPIRFLNVYEGWTQKARVVDEVIRYSVPHWEYLCELMKV